MAMLTVSERIADVFVSWYANPKHSFMRFYHNFVLILIMMKVAHVRRGEAGVFSLLMVSQNKGKAN